MSREISINNTAAEIKAAMDAERQRELARKQARSFEQTIIEETEEAMRRTGYRDCGLFDANRIADNVEGEVTAEKIAAAMVKEAHRVSLPELKGYIEKYGREW